MSTYFVCDGHVTEGFHKRLNVKRRSPLNSYPAMRYSAHGLFDGYLITTVLRASLTLSVETLE
jgi:hypothetical protein